MSDTAVTATARLPRIAALGIIRVLAFVIGVIATVVGIAYFVVSLTGTTVWWPTLGGGSFVDLPLPLRVVSAGSFLLWSLTTAAMAFILADLAGRVRLAVRFVPAVSRAVWALALTLAVGSTLAQIAQNIAWQSGPYYPDDVDPWTTDPTTLEVTWGIGWHSLLPNGVLLGLAIVLGVLAFIIQAGERLQRDTEGLV